MQNLKYLLALLTCLLLSTPNWAQRPAATENADTAAPVRALVEAMSREDAAAIRAQFAADAGQAYREETLKTPDKFRRWLESDIIARQGKVVDPVYTVDGDQVVVRGTYTSTGYRNAANFLFVVKNAKIVSWRMRY